MSRAHEVNRYQRRKDRGGAALLWLPVDQLVDVSRWRDWLTGGFGGRRLQQWSTDHPALVGWSADRMVTLAGGRSALELEAPQASPRTDAMQAALVELSQAGDAAATVTLLVHMRPGLIGLVRHIEHRRQWSQRDTIDEVRAVFFEILAGHCLERRPAKIAANLLLDTRQLLSRSFRPSAGPPAEVVGPEPRTGGRLGDRSGHGLGDGEHLVLTVQTMGAVIASLPGSAASRRLTANVAYRAWILGEPGPMIARELGIGQDGVRSRLHRLRRALHQEGSLQQSA